MTKKPKPKSATGNSVHKLTLHLKPTCVVFDDNPDPLLGSIEARIEEIFGKSYKPRIKVHKEASDPSQIDDWIRNADFVLLDNNLGRKFTGFSSGLEVGQRIVARRSDLPLAFYTAYPDDLEGPGLQEEFQRFRSCQTVEYYPKAELTPGKKLDELCRKIAFSYENEMIAEEDESEDVEELQTLLNAHVVSVKQFRYRVLEFDRRKQQQLLQCISEPAVGEISIPTRHLHLTQKEKPRDVILKILEFDGGQVLSYIVKSSTKKRELSETVLQFLEK